MRSSSRSGYRFGEQSVPLGNGECIICDKENKENKPGILRVQYFGGVGEISQYQDEDKATCRNQNFPMKTTITAYGVDYDVEDRQEIIIGEPDKKMDAETDFTFSADSSINCYIHTSCSQPLVAGDQIGPFLILEGGTCTFTELVASFCGDGIIDPLAGETCDEPILVDPGDMLGGCRQDCTYCGDGVVDPGEECDEGSSMIWQVAQDGTLFYGTETCKACRTPKCVCEAKGSYDPVTGSVTIDFDLCDDAEPREDDFVAIYPCDIHQLIVTDQAWFDMVCSEQLKTWDCEQTLMSLGYEKNKVYPGTSDTWMAFTCGDPGADDCQNRNNWNTIWPRSGSVTIDPAMFWDARWAFQFQGATLQPGCYKVVIQRDIRQVISAPPYPTVCKDWYEANYFMVP